MKCLFEEFSRHSKAEWLEQVKAELRVMQSAMSSPWRSPEGFLVEPVLTSEDVTRAVCLRVCQDWHIYEEVRADDPTVGNRKALEALHYGATSLCFTAETFTDFEALFNGIPLSGVRVDLKGFKDVGSTVKRFSETLSRKGSDAREVRGALRDVRIDAVPYLALLDRLPNYQALTVSSDPTKRHKEQLMRCLLEARALLRTLAPAKIQFKFTVGGNFFFELAKLRAFRAIWTQEVGMPPTVLCETNSGTTNTGVNGGNLYRTTIEALAAICGGCDALLIRHCGGDSSSVTGEAERLARNQHQILKLEGCLNRVQDPTGGAYYVEWLTNQFLEAAGGVHPTVVTSISSDSTSRSLWRTNESIEVKPRYSRADLAATEQLGFVAGSPPFLRGPHAAMYLARPWTIRQYAGFSTAEESNAFFKESLAAGQTGLSVAFDLPTQRGYDSDHERVAGDVGRAGVAIDSVMDMEVLFAQIPLEKVSVSMTMNGAVLPIMAFYIIAAELQGVKPAQLSGTIQNDILKEFMVRNTYIFSPNHSLRIAADIVSYAAAHMPKFNSMSVSGYHLHEAGAPADLELAYTLGNGIEYLRMGLSAGLQIDDFAPKISFFFAMGMNLFMEIAKLRVARMLWAKLVKRFGPRNPRSMALRTHCQTSGRSLTAQDPFNNVSRTCLEAWAAVLGGTQSLHTNALDEALGLPTAASARIARDNQIYLQRETEVRRVVDPLGGSYYLERLTHDLARRTWAHLEEIERLGGMTRAIHTGIPQMRIQEASIRRQARVDLGQEKVVGVNAYRADQQEPVPIREVDNASIRRTQQQRLDLLKSQRDNRSVAIALEAITSACQTGHGNLLAMAVVAARSKATLGEITFACEKVFSRYKVQFSTVTGVYANVMQNDGQFESARKLTLEFAKRAGRQPRILLTKVGQDGHDRGLALLAAGFADIGFDVDLGPLFQMPSECAKQAVENDVHLIGVSSLAGGHRTLVPEIIWALASFGRPDIMVAVGGIIPEQDHEWLRAQGVAGIFPPGTIIAEAAIELLKRLISTKE